MATPLPYKQYIWQLPGWPQFTWDELAVLKKLVVARNKQGKLLGTMAGLGFDMKNESTLSAVMANVLKTSEIEGEYLPMNEVRSSVAKNLGMPFAALDKVSQRVQGVVDMTMEATQYQQPLSVQRLFQWHHLLFPAGAKPGIGLYFVGQYRQPANDPMVVVSGQPGKTKVHFQAPPAETMPKQMDALLAWCNSDTDLDPVLQSAIAHLWFVTLHPFDDGNGRIARALADYFLAKADQTPQRFYSMSAAIMEDKKGYYLALETAQKGSTDLTQWLLWFLDTYIAAIDLASGTLAKTLFKATFWQDHAHLSFNPRQIKMLNLVMGPMWVGKINTAKYASVNHCSPDTALRDLQQLVGWGVLIQGQAGGRSSHYLLAAAMPV